MDTVQMAELETIVRLARKAREEGVHLLRDRRDGRYYATSATTPGERYYVTLASCTCPGFMAHQHCKHWAALNVAFILQDGGPDPETIVPTTAPACTTCYDAGLIDAPRSRWIGGSRDGYRDVWNVTEPCPDCAHTLDHAA